jgi:hypothetical protein
VVEKIEKMELIPNWCNHADTTDMQMLSEGNDSNWSAIMTRLILICWEKIIFN